MRALFRVAALATLTMALPAQAAQQAASQCLTEPELRSLARFALPGALNGLVGKCSATLTPESFMRKDGLSLVSRYNAGKQAAWPSAKTALFRMGGTDADTMKMIRQLPDEALQPFVDGLIGNLVSDQIKPDQCAIADRMMRLLAPLPPENMAELVSTIVVLADDPKKPGPFKVCKA